MNGLGRVVFLLPVQSRALLWPELVINNAEAVENSEPPRPSEGWELVKAWDFNNDTLPDGFSVRVMEPAGDSLEYSTKDNVWVYDDKLVESVRRHCIKKNGDPVTKENQTTGICPPGKKTVYSSGRIETSPFLTGNYKVEVKLRLADMAVEGMRTAVWVKNTLSYCDEPKTPNAEYDILEWYSAQPDVSTSTSHVFCEHGEFNSSYHKSIFDTEWMQKWHTYAVEVVDREITYFVDDEAVKTIDEDEYTDSESSFPGISSEQFREATSPSLPQMLILNTEGFNDQDAKNIAFRAPDNDEEFPVQKVEFESVLVYTKE